MCSISQQKCNWFFFNLPLSLASPLKLRNQFLLKSFIKCVMTLGLCHYKSDGLLHSVAACTSGEKAVFLIWLLKNEEKTQLWDKRHSCAYGRGCGSSCSSSDNKTCFSCSCWSSMGVINPVLQSPGSSQVFCPTGYAPIFTRNPSWLYAR